MNDIAFGKYVRSNLNKQYAKYVTDGNSNTYWSGIFYPAYIDIDLEAEYELDKVVVCVPKGKKVLFSLYGSFDGKNYKILYKLRNSTPTFENEYLVEFGEKVNCRILRVYMEYTEGDDTAYLSEVRVYGRFIKNSNLSRKGTIEEILDIKPFCDTEYANEITEQEIFENVYGIIDRTIGSQYRSWFSFSLLDAQTDNDYFELSDKNGKIHIKGNIGLSLTMGLNYYYKHYLNINISEQTMQTQMPDAFVPIGNKVCKKANFKIRYAFNYCTLCYTFAFFNEEQWQRENDWLALNGVNLVLDLAGQEAVWIKFLMNYGYSFDDAKDWLTGPAYYAWQFMDNMETFGGPVHDNYIIDRVRLARSSRRFRNSLGMQSILQGYAGMLPTNFNEFRPDIELIPQGMWNGLERPSMINTDSPIYKEFAKDFYKAQEFVYGKRDCYFAVDPFHEGGIRPENLSSETIAENVLESLISYNDKAVWIVQGWQSNPTHELLKGMGEYRNTNVFIVDLINYPITLNSKYDKTHYASTVLDTKEFCSTDWVWGLLGGFGGNPTLNGQLEVMVSDILNAMKSYKHMKGIGIISEAQYDNPIVYDLIFDLNFADEDFCLDKWISEYTHRRYAVQNDNADKAWQMMKNSNYNYGVRYTNEVYGMKNCGPADYRPQTVAYGTEYLEEALRYLLKDFEELKDSSGYRYDLSEILRQVVSNYSVLIYNELYSAITEKNIERFGKYKEKFLRSLEILNEVESTQKEQLAGEWIGKAVDLVEGYDDFSRDSFIFNAKALITTWASRGANRLLKDYAWRNYEGLFTDIYANAWKEYLDSVESNLLNNTPVTYKSIDDWFDTYWNWMLSEQNYMRIPKDKPEEIFEIAQKVINNCLLGKISDGTAGDIAYKRNIEVIGEVLDGLPENVTDGKTETSLTVMSNNEESAVIVDLIGEFELLKIYALMAENCTLKAEFSIDGIVWENCVVEKSVSNELTAINIPNVIARYVKISTDEKVLKLRNIRILGDRRLPEPPQLARIIALVKNNRFKVNADILSEANNVLAKVSTPDEIHFVYWRLYDELTK